MLRLIAALLCAVTCSAAVADEPTLAELKLKLAMLVEANDYGSQSAAANAEARPERTEATYTAAKEVSPPLVIKVSDKKPCPPGARAEKEIVAQLAEKGWRYGKHYTVVRSDNGPCPQFSWRGEPFSEDGYSGWDEWSGRLHVAMGVEPPPLRAAAATSGVPAGVAERVYQPPQAAPVGFSAPPVVTRASIPPARRTWTYNGRDLAAHVRNTHGIDTSGMSYSDLVKAHSHAHEGTWGAVSGRRVTVQAQPSYSAPLRTVRSQPARVMRSFCPTCPM